MPCERGETRQASPAIAIKECRRQHVCRYIFVFCRASLSSPWLPLAAPSSRGCRDGSADAAALRFAAACGQQESKLG